MQVSPRHAGDHQPAHAEIGEQRIERGGEKCRMLGFQHEVVFAFRRQELRERLAANAIVEAVLDDFAEIAAPAPEVIVGVNHRHARSPGACLEARDAARGRQHVRQQRFPALPFQVVDHVDDQQRSAEAVRGVAIPKKRSAAGPRVSAPGATAASPRTPW